MINRNLKTMLLGVFALIASTEMIYPIIFTGPGRRAAHRHEAEDAYAAGMTAGSAGGMMGAQNQEDNSNDYSNDESDVAIQMREMGPEYPNPFIEKNLKEDNQQIEAAIFDAQPVEVEAFDDQAIEADNDNNDDQRNEAQPMLAENLEVELMNPENPYADNQLGVDQALEDAELDYDLAAVNSDAILPEQEQAEQQAIADDQDDVATQSVEAEVQPQPVAVPTLLAAPVEKIKEVQAPAIHPVVAVQPASVVAPAPVVAQPASEQIKIVKVYPVYDAVRSAVKAVNNAVHDMINYVYSFVNSPKKEIAQSASVEVVQPIATK